MLTLLTTGIPARVATVLAMADSATYATFPTWAQCIVLSAYACQLGAETWGGNRTRAIAAFVSAMAAGGAASLFVASDGGAGAGGAATWAAQAVLQIWAFASISHVVKLEAHLARPV